MRQSIAPEASGVKGLFPCSFSSSSSSSSSSPSSSSSSSSPSSSLVLHAQSPISSIQSPMTK
ncbi:MAG: hypothetical protein FJ291_19420 [Planctomycetes bacterium]|nr:hypothetical protein [Planctomycetota bacterium]